MNNIKLSIIVPTKDRYKYLLPLIKMIDKFNFDNTEIVIEDNSSDNDEIQRFFKDNVFTIPIVYNHFSEQLSICQNIDNAINHSHGEYVCVIGDDDAVTPLIRGYVDWMDTNGVDSVRQSTELTYKWPGYTEDNGKTIGAYLTHGDVDNTYNVVDTKLAARDVVRSGIMTLGRMPCVYQGIIKRSILDQLYKIGGTYFPGPSPDMGNAMALCFMVNKHIVTNVPIIISGGSEFQGGKSKKIKKWVQPLCNIPFISDSAKSKWDRRIPYFWCGHTVWPESGIKGLEYVGKQDYLKEMDFDALLSKCMYRGYEYRSDILSRTDNKFKVVLLFIKFYIREHLALVKRKFMRKFNVTSYGITRVDGLMNIEQAISILIDKYNKKA